MNDYIPNYYYTQLLNIIDKAIHRQPEIKQLLVPLKNRGGRIKGRIIAVRRGALHKRISRLLDNKRIILQMHKGRILKLLRNINRTVGHCVVMYLLGICLHILRPTKVVVGDIVVNNAQTPQNNGDSSSLLMIPSGKIIHNLQGKYTRSAGGSTVLVRKDYNHALIKLKSGELRFYHLSVVATLGSLSNESWFIQNIKLAGRNRRYGWRPRNRPSARNPVDHPLGGRTKGGSQPKNVKGIVTLNHPTVKGKKNYIFFSKRELKLLRT